MEIVVCKNYDEMSEVAAKHAIEILKNKKDPVLGLATGTTPIGFYKRLISAYESKEVSFKNVHTVNLDEYVGLGEKDKDSYVWFMRDQLFNHVDIDLKNTYLPNGKANNAKEECEYYSSIIEKYPRDLQILGIGSNGHIAFNEPGTSFETKTHIVDLTENTIKDNSRLFDDPSKVPTQAFTMGIAEIMKAKKIILMANGANKANAIYAMVKGEISESCPASILQKHPNAIIIVDEAAASRL